MNALTCIGLLCLVATVYPQMAPWRSELSLGKPQYFKEVKDLTPLKPPSQTTPTTPSPEQINPYCNNGTCAGVPYETILNSYRGLVFFFIETAIIDQFHYRRNAFPIGHSSSALANRNSYFIQAYSSPKKNFKRSYCTRMLEHQNGYGVHL